MNAATLHDVLYRAKIGGFRWAKFIATGRAPNPHNPREYLIVIVAVFHAHGQIMTFERWNHTTAVRKWDDDMEFTKEIEDLTKLPMGDLYTLEHFTARMQGKTELALIENELP